jgi:flagellar hook-length control protein FliK
MSQFAMMPLQGAASSLKASAGLSSEGQQAGLSGEHEGLDFTQTLQELYESNPQAAALMLAFQQSGLLTEAPVSLQAGGSLLPPGIETSGKVLPLAMLQSLQLNSQQGLQVDELPLLDARQLQQSLGDKAMVDRGQMISQLVNTGVGAERLQTLESRGLGDFSSQLQGLGLTLQSNQAVAAPRPMIALPVQVPVGQPGWDTAMGERIQWMMSRQVQQAEIKLTPPDLGPVEIRLSIQNDQTSVHFLANHSATRDALEAAIPRLRELFGEINLNLADVDVNQRQTGTAGAQDGSAGSAGETPGQAGDQGYDPVQQKASGIVRLQSQGLLDLYA